VASKCIVFFVCLCLFLTVAGVYPASAETVDEYKERMKKEQEQADKKKQDEENKKKQQEDKEKAPPDSGNCLGGCLGGLCQAAGSGCFDAFWSAFFTVFAEVRYADFPFARNHGYDFAAFPGAPDEAGQRPDIGGKFWMIEAGAWGSYLFGQNESVFDSGGFINIDVTAFHANVYYQRLMSVSGSTLNTFSANLGISIPIMNFIMSFYAGGFWQEWSPWYVSFGTSGRVFIPGSFVAGWYTLFAVYDQFFYIVLSPSIEITLDRFTLGIGFNYYNYNNYVNFGPALKAGVWF
jgi:hypothetical protein